MEEELPFELYKKHKYQTIHNWKYKGLKETEETILEIYNRYIWASNCELCGNAFKNSKDRQMDHCHVTGKFRNIVCNRCNQYRSDKKCYTNTGHKFISKIKDKRYAQGFCYQIQIIRNRKKVLSTTRQTLEEAIEVRDKFIAEHPEIYT